jgi:spore coat polysaccharide biosynthesis protein SpsF (cytidylyltransferase family)
MLKETVFNLVRELKMAGLLKSAEKKNNRHLVIHLTDHISEIPEKYYWLIVRAWDVLKEHKIRLTIRNPGE